MSTGFSNLANFSSVLQSQRILIIDPFPRHLTVPTQLHCRLLFTCLDGCVRGPQDPWCVFNDFLSFSLFFPVYCRQLRTVRCRNFLSFTHPVFLTGPVRDNFIPDASSIVPPPSYASISCSCTGCCSYLSLAWSATISYFSI